MLTRWDPFEEMNRLHDHFFGGVERTANAAFRIAVDIREDDDAYIVDAEVPGVAAGDVKIDVEKNVLTLRGERSAEMEEQEANFRRVERRYGSFSRSFTLPETVDDENITANLKDGVLSVRLPKKEAPTPRQISVKAH